MYFPQTRWTPLGIAVFQGAELVGWKIAYRAALNIRQPLRLSRFTYKHPSRFGALRALFRELRPWLGKVFLLQIESIDPLYHAHYELEEDVLA